MSSQDPRLDLIHLSKPYVLQSNQALQKMEEPKMLLPGFLPANSVVGVTASPGVGKTWLMMELMRSACRGKFLGKWEWNVTIPRCLFVGSDASIHDYARQWRRIYHDHHQEELSIASMYKRTQFRDEDDYHEYLQGLSSGDPYENVSDADLRLDFLLQSDFMLDDPTACARLIKTAQGSGIPDRDLERVKEIHEYVDPDGEVSREVYWDWVCHNPGKMGYDVIIFDTLSRLTRANQNDNTEMENVFRNIRFIAEQTGATCILLHHNSKKSEHNGGEDWRGAVGQIGALDCWLQLRPTKNDKYIIHAEFKKFRGLTPEPFLYRMSVNAPGAAKLELVDNETKQETNFDLLTQEIYKYIVASSVPVNKLEIHEGIWAATADLTAGDRKAHLKKVEDRLRGIQRGAKFFNSKRLIQLPKVTDEQHELRRYHWATEEYGEED